MMRTMTPILSLAIAVLLAVFFTHPQYLETKEVQKKIDEYDKAAMAYQDFSNKLESKLAKKSGRSQNEIERLNTLVPEQIEDTQYLVDLEALAKKNNMLFGNTVVEGEEFRVTRQTDEVEAPKDELTTVDISFELVGRYDQFKTFLREMESSLTLFEVTRIAFTASEGPFQQFKLTVRTYALPAK